MVLIYICLVFAILSKKVQKSLKKVFGDREKKPFSGKNIQINMCNSENNSRV